MLTGPETDAPGRERFLLTPVHWATSHAKLHATYRLGSQETKPATAAEIAAAQADASSSESEAEQEQDHGQFAWLGIRKPTAEPETPEEAAKRERWAEERQKRTVFVGNLPVTVKDKHVKSLFKEYGEIESVRFRTVGLLQDGTTVQKKASIKL